MCVHVCYHVCTVYTVGGYLSCVGMFVCVSYNVQCVCVCVCVHACMYMYMCMHLLYNTNRFINNVVMLHIHVHIFC